MKLSFTKMQGCANDYIYLDCRKSGVPENIAALSEKLSRRHFSIGADGIICICAAQTAGADGMMRIFNADGSEGSMCGNGIRCVAEWLYTHGIAKETLAIDTLSGLKTVTHKGAGLWQVEMVAYSVMPASLPAVNMGEEPLVDKELTVDGKTWHVTCISVGNPHCVTVVEDVDSLIDEVSSAAYDKAVELVTDEVKTMTHQEDIDMIEDTKAWLQSPERKAPKKERDYAVARLDGVVRRIRKAMQSTLEKMKAMLLHADKKKAVTEEIKKQTKPSIVEALRRGMEEQRKKDSEKQAPEKQKKQNMEL